MLRYLSRDFFHHGILRYLFLLLLAGLSSYHPQPAPGDQTGGIRRAAVKARPYTEEQEEDSIHGRPPTFIPWKRKYHLKP